jgi:hypothetical protein
MTDDDNTKGHKCSSCGKPWVCLPLSTCTGISLFDYLTCPRCRQETGTDADGWRYLEDDFTEWVKEVRREKGA